MTEKNYVFTKDCRFRQQMTLGLTGFISLTTMLLAFYNQELRSWILAIIIVAVMIAVNFLAALLHQVRRDGQTVIVENIWYRTTYPIESLMEIRLMKFIFPYPFNPYIKFVFKDGKSFQGVIPLAMVVYLRTGIEKYLEDVRNQWLTSGTDLRRY